jgi:3-oxoacyl-[acyl-carrier protein] reductase
MCRVVVPRLLEAGSGRIVNIASISGKEGNPNISAYSSAKAAVIGFTKSLGKELATRNVLVNAVTPAVIETEILTQLTPAAVDYMVSRIPMGRTGKPEEVAALVSWLASDACRSRPGRCSTSAAAARRTDAAGPPARVQRRRAHPPLVGPG